MKINSLIRTTLANFAIPENDGIAYLLSIYYNCRPSYTPTLLVQRMNVTNILGIDENREVIWHIPLFEGEVENKWEWVKDWNEQFGQINKVRKGPIKSVLTRMKVFFSENPEVRVTDVMAATALYFGSISHADYLTSSHYFISKGVGRDRVSLLETWVEKYTERMKSNPVSPDAAFDITSQMQ